MSALFIDPQALKKAAQEVGVENPNQLSLKTGVHYRTCYRIWSEKEVLNVKLKVLLGFCEGLLVTPGALLTHSREVNYSEDQ